MKTFTVGNNDKGKRLDKFLSKVMPYAPMSLIYKSLRKKHIKVNSKRVTDGNLKLNQGDILEIYINDEFFSKTEKPFFAEIAPKLSVVYEDERIIVMNKPSGMLCQAEEGVESLEVHMRSYLYKKGEFDYEKENTFIPSLCHRIDRNTSGLVIGAKDAEGLKILNEKIRKREIRKFYLLRTQGIPKPKNGEIVGYLKKNEKTRKMEFSKYKVDGGLPCKTIYRTIKDGENPLVEAELLTGRTHQIRAGFGAMGCPLLGDVKYGAKSDGNNNYQFLISYKIIFDFKDNSGVLEYLKGKEIALDKI